MQMFRPETSFPFLKIAREAGVPYAKVLRMVDAIESQRTFLHDRADDVLFRAVVAAMDAERDRRAKAAP